ncbi:MAG: alpha/beta fold hydrolase [Gemmatimonadetes bacterium]|nr:alpha/beta fold hydrolase [Gemmatimonadota bacterium]
MRETPDGGEIRGTVLFAHAFGSSKDLRGTVRMARALAERGWVAVRFDFTGLGQSDGDFADTDLATNVADVKAMAAWLAAAGQAPRVLVGHSLGAVASFLAAPELPEVGVVVALAAPASTEQLRERLAQYAPELAAGRATSAEVEVAGKSVRIGRRLLEDLPRHDVAAAVAALDRPLLILHSPADEITPPDHAAMLFRAARHPKSFVSLDRADHLLLRDARDAEFVADLIAAFAERYRPE